MNTWDGPKQVWEGLWLVIWGAVILGFGWFFRRRPRREVVLAAILVFLAVTSGLQLLISAAGWQFSFDGP